MAGLPLEDRPSVTNVHAGQSEGAVLLLKAVGGSQGGKSEDEMTRHAANIVMVVVLVGIIMSLLHFCQYYAEKRKREANKTILIDSRQTPEPIDLKTF